MTQLTFETELRAILSQLGQVQRPDGSQKYVELRNGSGALENFKKLLVEAVVSESVDRRILYDIFMQMATTSGFFILDLFWLVPIERGVRPFITLLDFTLVLNDPHLINHFSSLNYFDISCKGFEYHWQMDEHMVNILMLVQYDQFEPIIQAMCNFMNHASGFYRATKDMANVLVKAYERLESNSAPLEKLIYMTRVLKFTSTDDREEEQNMLNTLNVNDTHFIKLMGYFIKYGNQELFFKYFDHYCKVLERERFNVDNKAVICIGRLCDSIKVVFYSDWISIEKQKEFLDLLLGRDIFKVDHFFIKQALFNSMMEHMPEWAIKQFMSLNSIVGINSFSVKFTDYRAKLARYREITLMKLTQYYDSPDLIDYKDEKLLHDEIVDRIDDLFNAGVAKDVISIIISFEFLVHCTAEQNIVQQMLNYFVDKRAAPAAVVPVDISRFGLA